MALRPIGPANRGPFAGPPSPIAPGLLFNGDTRLTENPARARQAGFLEVTQSLLLTTLSAALLLQAPHDWPNPARARAALQLEQSPNLVLAGIPQYGALRDPYFVAYWRKPWPAPDSYPDLLLSTLAASAALPFNQTDWPNPSRLRLAGQPEQVSAPLVLGFRPFKPYEWQNPAWRRAPPQPDQPPNLALAGIPKYPGFGPYEWPNSALRRAAAPEQGPSLLLGLLAPAASQPFAALDWPNPSRPRATPQLLDYPNLVLSGIPQLGQLRAAIVQASWQRKYAPPDQPPNLLLSTLSASAALPFSQTDWPNPSRSRGAVQPEQVSASLVLGFRPFGPYEWPNSGPRRAAAPEQGPSLLLGLLAPTASLPFAPIDWPNPARGLRGLPIEPAPNLVLAGIPRYPGFGPYDLSNPVRARSPQLELAPNLLFSTLAAPAALPFPAVEWPNPTRPRASQPEQAPNILLGALAPSTLPFRAFDWPNASRRSVAQPDIAPNLVLSGIPRYPNFPSYEWANPVRKAPPAQPHIQQNLFLLGTGVIAADAVFLKAAWDQRIARAVFDSRTLIESASDTSKRSAESDTTDRASNSDRTIH